MHINLFYKQPIILGLKKQLMSNFKIHLVLLASCFIFITVALLLYFTTFNNGLSITHQNWGEFGSFFSGIVTPLAFVSLAFSVYQTKYTTSKTNSLNVCISVLKELRGRSFLGHEKIIMERLPYIIDKVNSINDITDPELKHSIIEYCNVINNISVLVVHELIDDEIIIAYYGIQILNMYNLIFPLLEENKKSEYELIINSSYFERNDHGEKDKEMIAKAIRFQYGHFEILAKEIRKKGPAIMSNIEKKIK